MPHLTTFDVQVDVCLRGGALSSRRQEELGGGGVIPLRSVAYPTWLRPGTTQRPFRGSGVTVRFRWRRWEAVGGVLALWVPAGLTAHARARLRCPGVGSDEEAMHHIYDRSSGCCDMLARQAAASPLGAQRYGYLWVPEGAGRLSDLFTAVFTPRSQRVYR